MTRNLIRALVGAALIASPLLAAQASYADDRRGRGGDRGWDRGDRGRDHGRNWDRGRGGRGDHGRDWDRGRRDWDRRDYRRHDNDRLSLSFNFGRPYAYSYPSYSYPSYTYPGVVSPYYSSYPSYAGSYYSNSYGLRPYQCRTDVRFDFWNGRPAEVSVRLCADAYGSTYIVRDSHRFRRWR